MKLTFDVLRDKVMGCWAGKNAGGVLGAPYECKRGLFDIEFYLQDLSQGPPPNDDLDLQIVWLAAVERYGRQVNASILGEYWLGYVIPNWVEYGMGKNNLRAGLVPPFSGAVDNNYKDSCGCFIRSEIWACLAPGRPDIATRYAYEDGIVDHADEGLYAELFTAALQSAAFVESDTHKLIDIALTYIPEGCAVAHCVREAVRCFAQGLPFAEARVAVHECAPGTFGIQGRPLRALTEEERAMTLGVAGFDAPENIGYTMLGWLYGGGDFGRSLCLAVNCGEDTDCTAATLGAIMGIVSGASKLPEKWLAPLADKISTMCIDRTSWGIWVPSTVTELTDRVLRVIPSFLGVELCDLFAQGGYTVEALPLDALTCGGGEDHLPLMNGNMGMREKEASVVQLCAQGGKIVRHRFPAFDMEIHYHEGPFFKGGNPCRLTVTARDNGAMRQQQWAKFTLYAPEGVELPAGREFCLPLNYNHGSCASVTFEVLAPQGYPSGSMELVLSATLNGRHSAGAAVVKLMRKPH